MREHIELKFNCQEDLEAMPCTSNGRYCSACKKDVIDFTKSSISEIQRAKANQTDLCGIFLPQQIDPSLHPIELPKMRLWAFLSTIFVSLNLANVSAQSTIDPKVEQAQGTSNAPNLTPTEVKEKLENGQPISMSRGAQTATIKENNTENIDKRRQRRRNQMKRRGKRKLFWTWKFPFVHRKKLYKGRFY